MCTEERLKEVKTLPWKTYVFFLLHHSTFRRCVTVIVIVIDSRLSSLVGTTSGNSFTLHVHIDSFFALKFNIFVYFSVAER